MGAIRRAAAAGLALGAVAALGAPAGAQGSDLAAARAATAQYHRFDRADADGFGILADLQGLTCIEDPGGAGAMGTHFVNGPRVVDGVIDAAEPEVLLYDLRGDRPRLLAVEYVVFVADWGEDRDPPVLFGHEFHLVPAGNRYGLPPFYELHAWLWHHNPAGDHEDWNPEVGC